MLKVRSHNSCLAPEARDRTLPRFFIVGAPRCGTSALRTYLSQHPQVCMPFTAREPHFYAADLAGFRFVQREDDYRALFRIQSQHTIVGEKSAYYLHSSEAVPGILRTLPDAKFVVMLRNPIDLLFSYHQKLLWTLDEDREDLEQAWRLQEIRRAGKRIPRSCHFSFKLQYRDICSIGVQLERLLEVVPSSQVKIILFEQFTASPCLVYRKTLDFLGLLRDNRRLFPRLNESASYRFRLLRRLSKPKNSSIEETLHPSPRGSWTGVAGFVGNGLRRLDHWNRRPAGAPVISESFETELRTAFSPEIERIEALFDKHRFE
jgi:hypothetical protein